MNKKLIVCLTLFCGFVFGNQPSHYLFLKQQSVFIVDWRSAIIKPNAITFNNVFLTDAGNSNLMVNDSIQMQKTQSNANRVTFGKIALESAGALAGGVLLAYPISQVNKYDWQVGYPIGFSIGSAVGTTLVGNTLMQPNGSFLKSFIGSALGVALGGAIYIGYVFSLGLDLDPERKKEEIWYRIAAFGLPVLNATAGYNLGIPEINRDTINFNENFDGFNKMAKLQQAKYKLSLISVKF